VSAASPGDVAKAPYNRMPCMLLQILESIAIPVNLEDKESLIRAANT
jgi:hypothetical protein